MKKILLLALSLSPLSISIFSDSVCLYYEEEAIERSIGAGLQITLILLLGCLFTFFVDWVCNEK